MKPRSNNLINITDDGHIYNEEMFFKSLRREKHLMLLPLRALLGLMPGRTINKTRAAAISTAPTIVTTNMVVVVSIKRPYICCLSTLHVVINGIVAPIVLLLIASVDIVITTTASTSTTHAGRVIPTTRLSHCCPRCCRKFLHSFHRVVDFVLNGNGYVSPEKVVA